MEWTEQFLFRRQRWSKVTRKPRLARWSLLYFELPRRRLLRKQVNEPKTSTWPAIDFLLLLKRRKWFFEKKPSGCQVQRKTFAKERRSVHELARIEVKSSWTQEAAVSSSQKWALLLQKWHRQHSNTPEWRDSHHSNWFGTQHVLLVRRDTKNCGKWRKHKKNCTKRVSCSIRKKCRSFQFPIEAATATSTTRENSNISRSTRSSTALKNADRSWSKSRATAEFLIWLVRI